MPHAIILQDDQDAQDDELIQQTLDPQSQLDFSRDLEPGEKADDAVDFGDLSDGDLADDDFIDGEGVRQETFSLELRAQSTPVGNIASFDSSTVRGDFDDLFGEEAPLSPEAGPSLAQAPLSLDHPLANAFASDAQVRVQRNNAEATPEFLEASSSQISLGHGDPRTLGPQLSREQQLQQELFALSTSGVAYSEYLPEPPENHQELLAILWPKFEPNATPRFMDLLPPKIVKYTGKQATKPPKPLNPSRIRLELAQDQEKAFRISSGCNERAFEDMEKSGAISIHPETSVDKSSDEGSTMDSDYDQCDLHGVSWQDLRVLCEEWEPINYEGSTASEMAEEFGTEQATGKSVDGIGSDAVHGIERLPIGVGD